MSRTPKDMSVGSVYKTKNYGELEVVEYTSCSKVLCCFLATGFKCYAEAGDIRKGNVRDLLFPNIFGVGYCGIGDMPQSVSGVQAGAYSAWYNMLLRCYSRSKPARYKTYDDCTVCDEWHSYQNFASWFEANKVRGLELDKDILIDGNRVYSPETCSFVTGFDNKRKAREIEFSLVSPDGHIHSGVNVSEFCERFGLNGSNISMLMSGKRKSHKGWTRHE